MRALASRYPYERLLYHIRLLDDALAQMQRSGSTKRIIAELTFIKMCDPSLSENPAALLARIAALEEKIGLLSVGMPIIEANKAEKIGATESVDKTEKSDVKADNISIASPPSLKTDGLHPLPYWLELVESLSKQSRSAMGLRDGSKAFKDANNDRILIKFGNSFTMKLMSEESAKRALAAMISAREGRSVAIEKLIYTLVDKQELANDDLLDTLIE